MTTDQVLGCRKALEEKPNSARLMALLSIELSSQMTNQGPKDRNTEDTQPEALMLAQQSIQLCGTRPIGYYALSLASKSFDERIEALRMVVNLWTEECRMTMVGLATTLVRLLLEPRKEEGKVRGVSMSSLSHPSRRNMNNDEERLYHRLEQILQKAWTEKKISTSSRSQLAQIEYHLGSFFRKMEPAHTNSPRSIRHFSIVIRELPEEDSLVAKARFWKATQTSDDTILKCPPEYIVDLYSTFAERFDGLLVERLHYQTPTKLRLLVDSTIHASGEKALSKWTQAADLGCGTGLSGDAFRDCVENLTGVDLSQEMVARARARGCYDALVIGDLVSILGPDSKGVFDLIFSCDVFVYIGDLTEIFAAVSESLKKSGMFAFSTEYLDPGSKHRFKLQKSARFAHKQSYIEALASSFNFRTLKCEITALRKNAGVNVEGLLFVMTKD